MAKLSKTEAAIEAILFALGTSVEIRQLCAALDMKEIWALIDMSEKTRLHCMMLENCVYDYFKISNL